MAGFKKIDTKTKAEKPRGGVKKISEVIKAEKRQNTSPLSWRAEMPRPKGLNLAKVKESLETIELDKTIDTLARTSLEGTKSPDMDIDNDTPEAPRGGASPSVMF